MIKTDLQYLLTLYAHLVDDQNQAMAEGDDRTAADIEKQLFELDMQIYDIENEVNEHVKSSSGSRTHRL